jgi:hypothetical protein
MKKPYFTVMLLLLAIACATEYEAIRFRTVELKTNYDADISMVYDLAEGQTDLGKTINKQIEQSIIKTIGLDTTLNELTSVLDVFDEEYAKFKSEFPESKEPRWELHIETEKLYQSDEVISIAISVYQFQGGAHGNDQITLLNLNATTGTVLKLSDYINDIPAFTTLAKTYFIEALKKEDEKLELDDYFYGEPFHLPENIGYSDAGLVLLYNVYEIASYAQGYTEFAIPFEIADAYLKLF